jgi:hypothetical protein
MKMPDFIEGCTSGFNKWSVFSDQKKKKSLLLPTRRF